MRKIAEAANDEVEAKKQQRQSRKLKLVRPLGPLLRVIEVFTWSCMLSMLAVDRGGWEAYEPITLDSGWDVRVPGIQDAAMRYLERIDPDLVVVAWPCGPWSIVQNANQRTPLQRRALAWKRALARKTVLAFARRVILWQRQRGRAVLGENPRTSKAWRTPEIAEAIQGLEVGHFDQCEVGLVHPNTGEPMKKATQVVGQAEVVRHLNGLKCRGGHQHHPIEGTYTTEEGRSAALSDYAGGYPADVCHRILKGAEEFYQVRSQGTFVEDDDEYQFEDTVPEMVDGDEAIEEEDQLVERDEDQPFPERADQRDEHLEEEARHPVSREVRKAVEYAHRQLGHPSRSTLLRMMRLSGSNEEAI